MKKSFIIAGLATIVFSTSVTRGSTGNEGGIDMLQSGLVSPISYKANGIEQIEHIKYMVTEPRENGFYKIEIKYKKSSNRAYWMFRIGDIMNDNKITGQLSDISFEGADGILYIGDEKDTGRIEIDNEKNMVKIELKHRVHHNPPESYSIMFERKKPLESK